MHNIDCTEILCPHQAVMRCCIKRRAGTNSVPARLRYDTKLTLQAGHPVFGQFLKVQQINEAVTGQILLQCPE